jgi:hypothetical protein
MVQVPIPFGDAEKISIRAAEIARADIVSRGWSQKSVDSIVADPKEGMVGLRSTEQHMMYQDKGFGPFVMWWAEGRVIPINDSSGTHYVTGKDVGKPGWVTLPGGVKKFKQVKWQHPGLEPKNFLENAITQAIKENKPGIKEKLLSLVKGLGLWQ